MREEPGVRSVKPEELYELSRHRTVDLIDVSTPTEHAEVRVRFARNLPMGSPALERFLGHRHDPAEAPLYVMCRGGVRSLKLCRQHPGGSLVNVEGGTRLWIERGLPVIRDRGVLSLERQASLAAGMLLLLSAALGLRAASATAFTSAVVGAALVLAGATDRRILEVVLSRMPWNQAPRPRARAAH